MIEKNATTGEKIVRLAIVHSGPMGIDFGDAVRATRMKGSTFALGNFQYLPKHFGAAGLVEPGLNTSLTNRFENPNCAESGYVARVFWYVEADADVRLCRQVVNLIGLDSIKQFDEISRVGNITVVQKESHVS
jgi:hypothetical protein